ncbi:MAG: metal dependent phosphohydrolase, partial [Thermoleophilia bacterium]|nr:metal dependent phosphohydrolase [Thermoleophilia bacterium]
MTNRPRILRVPYHACSIIAVSIAVAQLASAGGDNVRAWLLLGGAIALLYAGLGMRVHDVRRSAGGASQSMHAAVATMLLYLVGPWIAVLAGATASVLYDLRRRRSPVRMAGNLPTRVVPILLAGLAWWQLAGDRGVGMLTLPDDYLAVAVSALVFAVTNELYFLWDAMSAADLSRARWRDEIDRLPGNLGTTMLECLVGAGVAVITLDNPWAAPVVVPLAASMYLALERGNRIQQVTDSALDTFATIVDERDRYTFEHSDRVCDYSMVIGRQLGLTERQLEALYWTSRLHDLGKVAVDNSILNKPGRLTSEEFELMKAHPEVSARILASFSFDEYDADVVRCHHERWDGRGYLLRDRDDVPFEAFIIAVADAFDAMTSHRPYRDALPRELALEEIALGLGTQFHPEVGRAFLTSMGFDLEQAIEE